jgi:hypothetical protein
MSDTSQGPGWWLASDGKWYPPEQWTGPPNTNPLGDQSGGLAQTSVPGQPTTQPSSAFPTPQPGGPGAAGSPGEPSTSGQPPAYGATQWPGTAPPVTPGYGSTPYGSATPYGQPGYVAAGGTSMNGLAIASFVCSIVGFFFITFIVAIVLGFVARSQIKKSGGQQRGDGLAIAGIIIGFAWVAFYVLLIIIGAVGNNTSSSVISLAGVISHIA